MPRPLLLALGAVATVAAGAAIALALAARRWDAESARIAETLRSPSDAPAARRLRAFDRAALPAPVARWLDATFPDGIPDVAHAVLRHEGDMFLKPGAPATPFTSVQHVRAAPAGFMWDARARMMPLVPARIRDRYVGGTGGMYVTLGGLIPLVHQEGTADMAVAALMRWAAEGPWLPVALLPRDGVRWEAADDHTATLVVEDAGTTVTLTATFADDGTIATIVGKRPLERDGRTEWHTWGGRHGDYRTIDGMRIPTRAEVWWDLPEGRWVYYRGTLVDAVYR
jgi:hypothetical protein